MKATEQDFPCADTNMLQGFEQIGNIAPLNGFRRTRPKYLGYMRHVCIMCHVIFRSHVICLES